jgi:hypothetical protein
MGEERRGAGGAPGRSPVGRGMSRALVCSGGPGGVREWRGGGAKSSPRAAKGSLRLFKRGANSGRHLPISGFPFIFARRQFTRPRRVRLGPPAKPAAGRRRLLRLRFLAREP